MNDSFVIKTTGIFYKYSRGVQTLSDINLQVERGSIFGFLGPNGSGKTTTLSLLLGLLNKQEGSIEVFGKSFHENRVNILKRTGSLIESPSLYGHLTARENLEVYRPIYGVNKERITEVLAITGLSDTGKKLTKRFSLGMKQRLAIALALLPNPELLILDEPANGLDPAGIIELRQLILKLNREFGITILISSHLLAEVEKMVSHVGIITKGKMLFQGSLQQLQSLRQKTSRVVLNTSNTEAAYDLLKEHGAEREDQALTIIYRDQHQIAQVNRMLTSHDLDVYLLQPRQYDLEQLFIHLTSSQS